jgi:dienelactone hydrolase
MRKILLGFVIIMAGTAAATGDLMGPGTPVAVRLLARTPAEWQPVRSDILRRAQLVLGPLPTAGRDLPLDPEVLESVDFPGYTRLKVAYQGEPGDRLTAYLLLPKKTGRLPAVLCLHQTYNYGKAEPAGLMGDPDMFYAQELAERGFVTLAPDYWPFGDYLGQPYDPYRAGYASAVMKGIWNHIRALDYLATRPEVDPERIGCIGHSLGGHNALWLGAFDDRVRAFVISCGFSTWASYAANSYSGGDLRNYSTVYYMPRIASEYGNDFRRMPFDYGEILATLAPRPVFLIAPKHDIIYPWKGVRDCAREAEPIYRLLGGAGWLQLHTPDAPHSFRPAIREEAYQFLARYLSHPQSAEGRIEAAFQQSDNPGILMPIRKSR